MSKDWTHDELESLLELTLPADSQERLYGLITEFSKGGRSPNAVRRMLWGLANRLHEYLPSNERLSGFLRRGPLSYTELLMISWGTDPQTKDKRKMGEPDAVHFAYLFCRTKPEMEEHWKLHGPAKGRAGFGLV